METKDIKQLSNKKNSADKDKRERLAAALRANLRRRKAADLGRDDSGEEESSS